MVLDLTKVQSWAIPARVLTLMATLPIVSLSYIHSSPRATWSLQFPTSTDTNHWYSWVHLHLHSLFHSYLAIDLEATRSFEQAGRRRKFEPPTTAEWPWRGIRGRGECGRNVGEVGLSNRLFVLVKFQFVIYASLRICNTQIPIGFYNSLGWSPKLRNPSLSKIFPQRRSEKCFFIPFQQFHGVEPTQCKDSPHALLPRLFLMTFHRSLITTNGSGCACMIPLVFDGTWIDQGYLWTGSISLTFVLEFTMTYVKAWRR